jgi:PEP-CTERM motif
MKNKMGEQPGSHSNRTIAGTRYKWLMIVVLLIALGMGLGVPSIASATPALGPQPWGEFQFGTPPDAAVACFGCVPSAGGNSFFLDAPPWTFSGPAILVVTDAFIAVDRFQVFDNLVSLGLTSAPSGVTPAQCDAGPAGDTSNPVFCFQDANYSHGVFALGDGSHSLTINHTAGIAGAAYFCAQGPSNCGVKLPEPSAMFLMGSGLVGLAAWGRRRLRM